MITELLQIEQPTSPIENLTKLRLKPTSKSVVFGKAQLR